MTRRARLASVMLLVACASPRARDEPVHLAVRRSGSVTTLELTPSAGTHINAAVAPAYEFAGRVLRFTGPLDPADSLYFAWSATARCPAHGTLDGVLRASICAVGERVCRSVRLPARISCP